ncbi:MAG: hypothetical protein NG784_15350 [Candidatus Jettenia sp.]|nr:hypothetical protein [Candidatus Jettenia sp.]
MCSRTFKQENQALFLALQDDAKLFPEGGIYGLAERLGCNYSTLANGLNPYHESNPPSLQKTIKIIRLAQARQTVFEICRLIDEVPVRINVRPDELSDESHIQKFLSTAKKASDFLGKGAEAAMDNRFDSSERKELKALLKALIQESIMLDRALGE